MRSARSGLDYWARKATTRLRATLLVTVPCAVISLIGFSTASGIYVLDIVDHFINRFGILLVAVVSMLVVAWVVRGLPQLRDHLNTDGSVPVRGWWIALMSVITPIALGYVLISELLAVLDETYGDYPGWMVLVFGWLAALAVLVVGFLLPRIPWRADTPVHGREREEA